MRAKGSKARATKLALLRNPTWRACSRCGSARPPEEFVGARPRNGSRELKSCCECRAKATAYGRMKRGAAESVRRLSPWRVTYKIGDDGPELTLDAKDFNYDYKFTDGK